MFNKVVLVGNLTRDIELKYANSGSAIANTAIATSRKFTQNGERKEEVCFMDITFFGRSAEVANQFLRRGSKVLVEGRIKFDQWVAQDGSKRSKHSVIVETMQMLDSKADSAAQGAGESTYGGAPAGGGYEAPAQAAPQSNYNNNNAQAPQQQYGQQQQQQSYGSGQQNNSYGNQQQQTQQQNHQKQEMPSAQAIPEIDIDEDEIPF